MINLTTLETPRLWLKGFSPADISYIFEHLPKADIKKLLGHRTEEDYLKEEYKYKNGYSSYNRSFKVFLLIDRATDKVIGRCGLHNWNMDDNRAEIGYVMLEEEYKRKGLMHEAVCAIMHYGFHELKLHRIEAIVGINNVPSLRLMKKNHFMEEGTMRQHRLSSGVYEDDKLFSILREEYLSKV